MFKYALFALIVLSNSQASSYDYFQSTRENMRQFDEDMDRTSRKMYERDVINALKEPTGIMLEGTKAPKQYNTFGR